MTMRAKTKAYQHKAAKRTNIPTDRDRVFMTDDDRERVAFSPAPASTGGPVLSWRRGSGVQDIKTDALPLYIHEKVNPSAFIEQLTQAATDGEQMDWFSEFNGLPVAAKYDWYKYKGHWQNRIIRGNSVDVMASLAAKEGMGG
ncbi:MAG: site-specific DNA-methyltransferase, partial [Chloroflexi bacterium]|nr:site-specific DNA-methyltransferase [Chloroflexota bacterium]